MKEKKVYICSNCGYKTSKWMGKCPQCDQWDSLEESIETKSSRTVSLAEPTVKSEKLINVKTVSEYRYITGIEEFDRVLGGGIVKDSLTIITSPPGVGKSTLALTVANVVSQKGFNVLYASGEESVNQIKKRADRILPSIGENIWIISTTSMNNVISAVNETSPDVIVIDSIQTFALQEFYPARAGNPTQTMECAGELVRIAKNPTSPKAVIIIGQMNKNDELAGLRALEHLVDTVIIMDGESDSELRSITATKNRFGPTGEMGFFTMTEKGLVSIENPSEYFVTQRDADKIVSGSAITVIKEGSRPIIAEIESLVSPSYTPYPSRIGDSVRREQLNTLVSILEQRCGLNLYDKNVVIKTTGGIKLKEQSSNLAVIMSIVSSVKNTPIPNDYAFIADVGLTGELKKVPSMDVRIRELDRMGFKKVFIADKNTKNIKTENINVISFDTVKDVINFIF